MKKVLLLGSLGMLGHVVYRYLKSIGAYQLISVAREETEIVDHVLDVSDFEKLRSLLVEVNPDIVINCVGVLITQACNDICNAILLNSYLPNFLASQGNQLNFKLIHVSTDCVFSGKHGAYTESSFRDGDDNYARSKALGEVDDFGHLTLRTSIIGPELKADGVGLMHWFFNQTGEISGYDCAYWSGVTTLELAKVIHYLIDKPLSGLIQVCPDQKISKYNLLLLLNDVWQRAITIHKNSEYQVDKSLRCTRDDFDYLVPTYNEMLEDLKLWTDSHKDHYPHYCF